MDVPADSIELFSAFAADIVWLGRPPTRIDRRDVRLLLGKPARKRGNKPQVR